MIKWLFILGLCLAWVGTIEVILTPVPGAYDTGAMFWVVIGIGVCLMVLSWVSC
jgi:hypothetical protein